MTNHSSGTISTLPIYPVGLRDSQHAPGCVAGVVTEDIIHLVPNAGPRAMSELDEYLRDVLAEAQERFPEAGILMVSVEDCDDETSQCDISFFTNMGSDEVADVVKTIPDWEDTSPKVRH